MLQGDINREGLMMCRGSLMPIESYLGYVNRNSYEFNRAQAEDYNLTQRALLDENIIIPLERNPTLDIETHGVKGFRPVDYRVLTHEQMKTFFGMYDKHINRVNIPYSSPFTASLIGDGTLPVEVEEFETYDRLINITYLVDEKSLFKFVKGEQYFEEEYVSEKKIKDASIEEMLFALNKKLDLEKNGKINKS